MPQPQQQQSQWPEASTLVVGAFRSYNLAFLPWFRRGNGTHAHRLGIFTLFGIILYSANCPEILYYIPVWLLLILFRKARADKTQASSFLGWSIFNRRMRESRARIFEPFVLGLIGLLILQVSEPIGVFVMGGALSMLSTHAMDLGVINQQKRIGRDRGIQAEVQARIYKGESWMD